MILPRQIRITLYIVIVLAALGWWVGYQMVLAEREKHTANAPPRPDGTLGGGRLVIPEGGGEAYGVYGGDGITPR